MRERLHTLCILAVTLSALNCSSNNATPTVETEDGGTSSDSTHPAPDGSADIGTHADIGDIIFDAGPPDGTVLDTGVPPDPDWTPFPANFPTGWTKIDTQDGLCPYYAAASEAASIPEPILWRTCSSSWMPPGSLCLRPDTWPKSTYILATSMSKIPYAGRDAVVFSYRVHGLWGVVWTAGILDGPTFNSVALTFPSGTTMSTSPCSCVTCRAYDGNFAVTCGRKENTRTIIKGAAGALCASLGDLPSQSWWVPNTDVVSLTDEYIPSARYLVRWDGSLYAGRWPDNADEVLISSADMDPDGLPPSPESTIIVEESIIFSADTSYKNAIRIWDPVRGLRRFIDFSGDQHGAGNLGFDGTTLVWTEASGRFDDWPSGDALYREYRTMAAPYTTDPITLSNSARVIALEPYGSLDVGEKARYQVGCGYASRWLGGGGGGLFIVRLSDGAAWLVPPPPSPAHWNAVVAVTCEEIIVPFMNENYYTDIARIPLSALGPPAVLPPPR